MKAISRGRSLGELLLSRTKTRDVSRFQTRADGRYRGDRVSVDRKIEDRRGQLIKANEYRLNESARGGDSLARSVARVPARMDDKNKSIVARPVNWKQIVTGANDCDRTLLSYRSQLQRRSRSLEGAPNSASGAAVIAIINTSNGASAGSRLNPLSSLKSLV